MKKNFRNYEKASKQIIHYVNKDNDFKYEVVNLADYDTSEIINNIRNQLKSGMKAEIIAKTADIPLARVKSIERKLKGY